MPELPFVCQMRYNKEDGQALLTWYVAEAKTQYCLYSGIAGQPDMLIMGAVELLQAAD